MGVRPAGKSVSRIAAVTSEAFAQMLSHEVASSELEVQEHCDSGELRQQDEAKASHSEPMDRMHGGPVHPRAATRWSGRAVSHPFLRVGGEKGDS